MKLTSSERQFEEFEIPIEHVLINRGVDDPEIRENFMRDTLDKYENDYSLLDNVQEGIDCIEKHIAEQGKIYLIVDSDVDGYTSAAIITLYLKERYSDLDEIHFIMHDGKEHGIILDNIPEDCDLLIVPDAGRVKTA